MTPPLMRPADDITHHLDEEQRPRVVLPLAVYTRLRAIEAAAVAHVAECHAPAAADGAYAAKHPTLAARSAAMAALLIARRDIVASTAGLMKAVAQ